MESSARFLVQIGAQPQRNYPIERETTIAGREAINDLVLNDAEVSRRHTRVIRDADGYYVEDLGSTNGTFVNGKRVTVPTLLYNGDIVELGKSVRLVFQLDQPYEQMTRPVELEPDVRPIAQQPPAPPPEDDYVQIGQPPQYEQQAYDDEPAYDPPPQRPSRPVYEEPQPEYSQQDSAEYYRPPSAQEASDSRTREDHDAAYNYDDEDEEIAGCQRYFVTCGCLLLLFIFLFGALLFTLDALAPDMLYCGRLQGFWETLLSPVLRLTARVWVCP